jgi:hypothetical protein
VAALVALVRHHAITPADTCLALLGSVQHTVRLVVCDYDPMFAGPNPSLWTASKWQTRWHEFMSAHFRRVVTHTRLWLTSKLDELDRVWHEAHASCGADED